ncbi:MAG: Mur ligase family protein [Candidatus Zixiibacteriota bacterium]
MAFDYFARQAVDVAVIETGLGGRLDATNVLKPALTIITDINYDHVEILGPTLEAIAGEKAGIIKPGVPNVIGLLPREARRVVAAACRERGSELVTLRHGDFSADMKQLTLSFHSDDSRFENLTPALRGPHQLRNTAVVLKAVEVLRRQGISLSGRAIKRGVEHTVWAGRFQIVREGARSPVVVLDVCHNPGGAAAFVDTFKRVFPGRKASIIAGFVKRKAHQEMIDHLARVADSFRLVPLKTGRSVDTRELVSALDWHGVPVKRFSRFEMAYDRLLENADPSDIIAIIGSHYLVGEYLSKYGRQ